MHVLYTIKKVAGPGHTKTSDLGHTEKSMAMEIYLGAGQKTGGYTEKKECTVVTLERRVPLPRVQEARELNEIVQRHDFNIPIDNSIAIEPLSSISGSFNNLPVKV